MFGLGIYEFIIIGIIGIVIVLPYWKIFSKAGYSGWLSLILFVPFLAFVIPFYLAFAEWPIQREIKRLRNRPDNTVKE